MFCANQFEYYFEILSAAEVVDTFPDLVSATEKPMLYVPIGIKFPKGSYNGFSTVNHSSANQM